MTNHTQGKLILEKHAVIRGGEAREYTNGSIQDQVALATVTESGDQLENARRLVACWNACDGIDTEQLEILGDNDTTLKERYEALKAEMKAVPLAKKHEGMMVDYSGMIRQCSDAIKRKSAFQAEILRQFQKHLEEFGKRFYAGDLTVVDEFLQLYCVAEEDRERVVAEQSKEAA